MNVDNDSDEGMYRYVIVSILSLRYLDIEPSRPQSPQSESEDGDDAQFAEGKHDIELDA